MALTGAWQRWRALEERIAAGEVLVLDGGMGSEVEKIAGKEALNCCGWTSTCNLTHPLAVKQAHRHFLDAGADILIANTYSTNRHNLVVAGAADSIEQNNLDALRLARKAVKEWREATNSSKDIFIAASMSIHTPGNETEKYKNVTQWCPPCEEVANYVEQARLLIKGGADMIFCELLWSLDHSRHLLEALKSLPPSESPPIFVGISCFADSIEIESVDTRDPPYFVGNIQARKPKPVSPGVPLTSVVKEFVAHESVVGVSMMHTKSDLMLRCLQDVRAAGWSGPLAAYPDSGMWLKDGWGTDAFTPEELVKHAKEWHSLTKTQIIGGCCGLGPDHIQALSEWVASMKPSACEPEEN